MNKKFSILLQTCNVVLFMLLLMGATYTALYTNFADTITARHTFSTGGAPFTLAASDQGQLVTGFRAATADDLTSVSGSPCAANTAVTALSGHTITCSAISASGLTSVSGVPCAAGQAVTDFSGSTFTCSSITASSTDAVAFFGGSGGSVIGAGVDNYFTIYMAVGATATDNLFAYQWYSGRNGTFRNFYCKLGAAPGIAGSGKARTADIRDATSAANCGFSCSFFETVTTCSDTTTQCTYTATHNIEQKWTATSTPASAAGNCYVEFVPSS